MDCRDRYKNHLSERNTRNTGTLSFRGLLFSWCISINGYGWLIGAWTEAEEQELIRIVREVQEDQGKDYGDSNEILWSTVSARMGGRRGKQQARDKWSVLRSDTRTELLIVRRRFNQLRSRVQNEAKKLKWTDKDSVVLLRRYDLRFFSPLRSRLTYQLTVDLHP